MAILEYIQHYTAVRVRVKGSGSLQLQLLSLDGTVTQTVPSITMSATTNIVPTKLANFVQQRAQLKITTTAIDETFEINQITVFVKPIFSSYPQ